MDSMTGIKHARIPAFFIPGEFVYLRINRDDGNLLLSQPADQLGILGLRRMADIQNNDNTGLGRTCLQIGHN